MLMTLLATEARDIVQGKTKHLSVSFNHTRSWHKNNCALVLARVDESRLKTLSLQRTYNQ